MADKRSVRFIYVATGQPVPELIDRSRDAIYFLEEAQQLWVGDKLIADHIDPVDLDAYLSPWHVKSVDIQGEGTFVASVAFDDATGKLTFTKGTPPALAKGVDIENAPVQLGFGDSVKLVKGTAVADNTIRDDTVVYTLPELPDQIDTVEILNNNGTITVRTTYASGEVRESSITLQLAGALHFLGTSTTPVTDGGREHPKINNREMDTEQLHVGDVVRYSPTGDNNYIEFMWVEDDEGTGRWSSIGDESSYTPKTRRVDAGEGLSGGGALTEDVTISHGQTGTGEDHTYTDGDLSEDNFKIPTSVEVDAFGHVNGVEFGDGKSVVEAIAENKVDERLENFYDKDTVDTKLQETLDAALAADATIEVVGEGPDVLSAEYDEEANKLTITIGEALPGVEILYDEDPEDPLEVELDEETGELRIVSEDTAGAPFIIPITKSGSSYRTEVTAPEIRAHKYNCAVQLDGVVMRCCAYQDNQTLKLIADRTDSGADGTPVTTRVAVVAKRSTVSVSVDLLQPKDASPFELHINMNGDSPSVIETADEILAHWDNCVLVSSSTDAEGVEMRIPCAGAASYGNTLGILFRQTLSRTWPLILTAWYNVTVTDGQVSVSFAHESEDISLRIGNLHVTERADGSAYSHTSRSAYEDYRSLVVHLTDKNNVIHNFLVTSDKTMSKRVVYTGQYTEISDDEITIVEVVIDDTDTSKDDPTVTLERTTTSYMTEQELQDLWDSIEV